MKKWLKCASLAMFYLHSVFVLSLPKWRALLVLASDRYVCVCARERSGWEMQILCDGAHFRLQAAERAAGMTRVLVLLASTHCRARLCVVMRLLWPLETTAEIHAFNQIEWFQRSQIAELAASTRWGIGNRLAASGSQDKAFNLGSKLLSLE